MITTDELLEVDVSPDLLTHVEGESVLYARTQGDVSTLVTSRGHLFRMSGNELEMNALRPAVSIRSMRAAIAIRSAHGVEAMLFEPDPDRRNVLFRQLVDALT